MNNLLTSGNGMVAISLPTRRSTKVKAYPLYRHVTKDNRKTYVEFRCVECGNETHADHVGALNVLAS